jgi:ubiquinone/menaquinone biosynthesis C-methylase UbiE
LKHAKRLRTIIYSKVSTPVPGVSHRQKSSVEGDMAQTISDAPWHEGWSNLDQSADPHWYVKFLDATRGRMTALIEQDPARYFAFLEPKPGGEILDVGTGTGVLVHGLAPLVDPGGEVVGVDLSQTMVDEATKRATNLPGKIRFEKGNAMALSFKDNTFDAAMSSIVFQHLPDPGLALSEMVRVTKPGGTVTIIEQDWETFVIDCGDKAVTRRISNFFCDRVPNGWIGRELYRYFCGAGLCNVHIIPANHILCGEPANMLASMIRETLDRAEATKAITPAEREAWQMEFEARVEANSLFLGFTMFRAIGRKRNGEC